MSLAAIQFAVNVRLENSTDKLVLTYLCWHKNDETGSCFPSTDLLLRETSLNKRTLFKSLRNLESLGLIRRVSQIGKTNQYFINETWGKNAPASDAPASNAPSADMHLVQNCTTCKNAPAHSADMHQHLVQKCTTKEKERKVKEKIGLPYETLPFEWWVACRDIRKDLNPKAVFEEFKDYWLSDSAKGNGLKSDWLRTWKNWVRSTKVKPFNAAPSSGIAVRNLLESLYRGTDEEAKAEQWFFEKTGMHDFGREEEPQKPKDNRPEQEVRSFIRSVLAGGGLAITGASKNA